MFFDIYTRVQDTGSKERQKEEINAYEGNKRIRRQESQSEEEIEGGGKGGDGRLQEPICPRGGAASSAPRTAPVFVFVQTLAPAYSLAAIAGAPLLSPRNLLWEERRGEIERER